MGEWRIQSSLSPGAVSCSLFPTSLVRLGLCGPSARPGKDPSARKGVQLLRGGFILDLEGQGWEVSGVVLETTMRRSSLGIWLTEVRKS